MRNKQSLIYILVNVTVAFLGFVRSFAFMKFFDFGELGTITLVSTGASLIGLFQLGLINGGYRIIALDKAERDDKVNNVIFSYFTMLSVLLIIISSAMLAIGVLDHIMISLLSVVMGVCMLCTNWLTNMLIGAQEYRKLNIANLIGVGASILCLIFGYFFGLYGALFSLLIQPLLFVLFIFIIYKNAVPKRIDFDFSYIRYILKFGFIPFLSGIFFLLYQQVERWSINLFLGPEGLGKMYLVFLTTTLWVLIPTSINNIYFPKTVQAFSTKNYKLFYDNIKQNFLVIIAYSIVSSVLIILLLNPLIKLAFPNHLPYLKLVFILLPGLIFKILCDPITLSMNSMVKLRPIFWSDLLSIIFYIIMASSLAFFKVFSLENIVICSVLYNFIKFAYLFFIFYKTKSDAVFQD